MGCPTGPLVTNVFMEEFDVKAISSATCLPHLSFRFVDNTFIIQQVKHSQQLLKHINSLDPHIQFTTEDPNKEGALPFLDTLVSPGPNNTLTATMFSTQASTFIWTAITTSQCKPKQCFNTLAYRPG